jgi:hypothetical protein
MGPPDDFSGALGKYFERYKIDSPEKAKRVARFILAGARKPLALASG